MAHKPTQRRYNLDSETKSKQDSAPNPNLNLNPNYFGLHQEVVRSGLVTPHNISPFLDKQLVLELKFWIMFDKVGEGLPSGIHLQRPPPTGPANVELLGGRWNEEIGRAHV